MLGSVILGIGSKSSQFTDKLVNEIASGPQNHGIIAAGVYTGPHGEKLRSGIHKSIGRMRAMDISVTPTINPNVADRVLDDLVELQRKVARLEPESVLLIVDATFMNKREYAEVFHLLRVTLQQRGKMSALCFIDDPENDANALATLKSYTVSSPTAHNNPILDAVFVARVIGSPLSNAVGGANPQMELLAKSMAQIWQAHLYYNFNPTFDDQVQLMRQAGHNFIGLAVGSVGLSGQEKPGLVARLFKPALSGHQAQRQLIQLTEDLLQNQPEARTTVQPLDLDLTARTQPITVNLIAPFRTTDPRFDEVRDGVQKALRGDGYKVAHTSLIPGNGSPVSMQTPPQGASYPAYSQPGYAPNDYPPGYAPSGYAQPGYGNISTDAPTISPGKRVDGALAPRPPAPSTTGGVYSEPSTSRKIQDQFIGQVCIVFGIEPEHV